MTGRLGVLSERVSEELSRRSGNKFVPEAKSNGSYLCVNVCRIERGDYKEHFLRYPVKTLDGRELGLMYVRADFCALYFDGHRRIRWPDDWIDPYPVFINMAKITGDYVEVEKGRDMPLYFMSLAYYAVDVSDEDLIDREDRMKSARFIPAIVKDFNILLRLLNEVCGKYEIDKSEVKLEPYFFDCSLRFNTSDMSDDEVVEKTLVRAEALAELRRRFREWLPSEERKRYYEDTMLFPEDPFRRRIRAPDATPAEGFSWSRFEGRPRLCKIENASKHSFVEYQKLVKYYDLDGNRLRLARKVDGRLKFIGRVDRRGRVRIDETELRKENLDRDDIVIAVDKRMKKLPKFPLEKIEFLKEDFPEMFK